MGQVEAQEDLVYNKNSIPTFVFNNQPLIYSMKGSYDIDNTTIGGNIQNYNDENIKLNYLLFGHKVIPGIKIRSGPTYEINQSTGEEKIIDNNISDWYEIKYETEMEGINAYLNSLSIQTNFYVNYEVLNSNVKKISPFIFDLGNWPVTVNNEKIDDILGKQINDNLILIYGADKVLIINKQNIDFSYRFTKNNGNYTLSIEKVILGPEKNELKIYFRPVIIEYSIKILDFYPSNIRESLIYKPELKIDISNKNITQLNFTYISNNQQKVITKTIDSNGSIVFDEWVQSNGNQILYPFDSYKSEISVDPPLLINNKEDIKMPINAQGFTGSIEILNNKILINFGRPTYLLAYFIGIMLFAFIILIAQLLYTKNADSIIIFLTFSAALILPTIYLAGKYPTSLWVQFYAVEWILGVILIIDRNLIFK